MSKPTLDDLMRSARGDEPSEEQLQKLERKLAPLFALPPGGGGGGGHGAGGGGAAAKGAAAMKHGAALKWIGAALTASIIGGGVAVHHVMTREPERVEAALPPTPSPPPSPPPPPPPSPSPPPSPPPRPAPKRSTLADEAALLDHAQSQLRGGDAAGALASCEKHARTYSHGELREERERIAIEALVALGRHDDANARAKRFQIAFPNSVQWPRIHALLAR